LVYQADNDFSFAIFSVAGGIRSYWYFSGLSLF